jgi:NADH dehydrogenase FAD-containing subunit
VHKWFPELERHVRISLVEAGSKLLGAFDRELAEYTLRTFKRRAIDVRLNVGVVRVEPNKVQRDRRPRRTGV